MEIFLFWFIMSVVVGVVASSRGRPGFGYFILSLILSPLIGFILAVALPKVNAADPDKPTPNTHVRCPDCRELVRHDAVICKHCRCKLVPQLPRG